MNESMIVDIKRIRGNKVNAGIYALFSNFSAQRLIDSNNKVDMFSNINVVDKIKILEIVIYKMLTKKFDNNLECIGLLFSKKIDNDSYYEELELKVNELYEKVEFLYSKPKVDVKELKSIYDFVKNRLRQNNFNNEFVNQELKKRLHYV